MKKISLVLSIICIIFLLCACGEKSRITKHFSERKSDYRTVARYMIDNYSDYEKLKDDNAEYLAVSLNDIREIDEIKSSVDVAMKDFTYIWVDKFYVVFWNDETKTVGDCVFIKPGYCYKRLQKMV